jgi:hypothetical protein
LHVFGPQRELSIMPQAGLTNTPQSHQYDHNHNGNEDNGN